MALTMGAYGAQNNFADVGSRAISGIICRFVILCTYLEAHGPAFDMDYGGTL